MADRSAAFCARAPADPLGAPGSRGRHASAVVTSDPKSAAHDGNPALAQAPTTRPAWWPWRRPSRASTRSTPSPISSSARPTSSRTPRRWRPRAWRTPAQPALHLRRHGPRQDPLVHAIAYRVREERPERAHRLHQRRALRERVRPGAAGPADERFPRAATARSAICSWSTTFTFSPARRRPRKSSSTPSTPCIRSSKQIVVTSDKYPQQLDKMEERLVSRFHVGPGRRHPGAGARDARRHRAQEGAARAHRSGRRGVPLHRADGPQQRARARGDAHPPRGQGVAPRPIHRPRLRPDRDCARRTTRRPNEASVEDIQRVVCHHFKLRSTDLLSKDRHKSIAFARHVAMYLCKQRLKCSFPELGRAFGNRDHTTVISAVRKVEALRTSDPEVRAHLEAIERKLGAGRTSTRRSGLRRAQHDCVRRLHGGRTREGRSAAHGPAGQPSLH